MDRDALTRELTQEFQQSLKDAMDAVERAPDGAWIAGIYGARTGVVANDADVLVASKEIVVHDSSPLTLGTGEWRLQGIPAMEPSLVLGTGPASATAIAASRDARSIMATRPGRARQPTAGRCASGHC